MSARGETRSPRRVSPNVEEGPSAECPIGPGSTRPLQRSGVRRTRHELGARGTGRSAARVRSEKEPRRMELLFETQVNPTITPFDGGDDSLRRAREAVSDELRWRRCNATLAGSREGLVQLPRLLDRIAETALSARRLAGPLPAGAASDVLGGALAALGQRDLPQEGIGAEA